MTNPSYLNDPDFDRPEIPDKPTVERSGNQFWLHQVNPKSALIAGFVGGIMTLGTIGFIILLIWLLRGGFSS